MQGLADLKIEERLQQFINGGRKPSESTLFPGCSNTMNSSASVGDLGSRNSRVLEGDLINTDITAPGAIIALSLIYIRFE
jgi:anaphase-promoting complex subunit 1